MRTATVTILLLVGVPAFGDSPTDIDMEIAHKHFMSGALLYDNGRYAEALEEFEKARQVRPHPSLDFDIARCLDRLERVPEAIEAYVRYLRSVPSAADIAEASARVDVLKKRLSGVMGSDAPPAKAVVSAPVQAPLPSATTPLPAPRVAVVETKVITPVVSDAPVSIWKRRRLVTWVVGGAGMAMLAGSLAAGLVSSSRLSSLQDTCANFTCPSGSQGTIDSGKNAAIVADVLLGVGVGAVTAGAVLFFFEGKKAGPIRVGWGPGTVGLSLGGAL